MTFRQANVFYNRKIVIMIIYFFYNRVALQISFEMSFMNCYTHFSYEVIVKTLLPNFKTFEILHSSPEHSHILFTFFPYNIESMEKI
jgi:hypothetical protein